MAKKVKKMTEMEYLDLRFRVVKNLADEAYAAAKLTNEVKAEEFISVMNRMVAEQDGELEDFVYSFYEEVFPDKMYNEFMEGYIDPDQPISYFSSDEIMGEVKADVALGLIKQFGIPEYYEEVVKIGTEKNLLDNKIYMAKAMMDIQPTEEAYKLMVDFCYGGNWFLYEYRDNVMIKRIVN